MINMLLNASITGGIVILLWYLTYPLSRKYFKASWHYAILKIMMVFMLFPIGIFAPILNNIFAGLFAQPNLHISEQIQRISIDTETINSVNTALSDFVFPSVQYSPQLPQTDNAIKQPDSVNNHADNLTDDIKNKMPNIPYLQIIWLIVATVLFSNGIHKMHKFKKQILNNSNSDVEHETQELFLQCRKQLKIRGKITLRISKHTKTPFVFGLINPIIIFPETDMNADEKRLALIHELTHVKNGDLWLKFIAFIISTIHWFNPFAHLIYRKISFVSEEYCDERVVKTMTQDERFLYGNLILKVVADIAAPQSKFCSTLSAPTKNLKRRLFNMMKLKKSRKSMVALSVITAFIFCSLATVYAFAADTGTPENAPSDLPENSTAETPEETPNIYTEEEKGGYTFIGTIGLGYTNSSGEEMVRLSNDNGATWYAEEEIYKDNRIPDTNLSAIEWLTYDELRAWIDMQDRTAEEIEKYESMLEELKLKGMGTVGRIFIENVERVILFTQSTTVNGVEVTYEEFAEYMATNDTGVESPMIGDVEVTVADGILQTVDGVVVTDEWLEEYKSTYDSMKNNDASVKYYYPDYNEIQQTISSYEYFTVIVDDKLAVCADTYTELYSTLAKFFQKYIKDGKMTQEEADSKLAELSEENTRVVHNLDSAGNIIND